MANSPLRSDLISKIVGLPGWTDSLMPSSGTSNPCWTSAVVTSSATVSPCLIRISAGLMLYFFISTLTCTAGFGPRPHPASDSARDAATAYNTVLEFVIINFVGSARYVRDYLQQYRSLIRI